MREKLQTLSLVVLREFAKDKKIKKIGRVIAYTTIILFIILVALIILEAVAPELIYGFFI